MAKDDILRKIKDLVKDISSSSGKKEFREHDVVYILVEIFKIKEREFKETKENIREVLPIISFFRDWVVHTNLNNRFWFKKKAELDNSKELLTQILSILEDEEVKSNFNNMWQSFEKSLYLILKDQDIFLKDK